MRKTQKFSACTAESFKVPQKWQKWQKYFQPVRLRLGHTESTEIAEKSACTADDERNTDCTYADIACTTTEVIIKFKDQSSMFKVQRSKDSAPAGKKDKPPL